MKTINDFNFRGRKALVRVDFNVPLDATQKVSDDTRINAAIPTIKKIIEDQGACILMSHLGRPKGRADEKFSLRHILANLKSKLGDKVTFAGDCVGKSAKEFSRQLEGGSVLLLENVRFHSEETSGDPAFAKQLATLGDIYVNDAFGTAHRAHASTTVIAQFFQDKCAGYVLQKEIENAEKVLGNAKKPFTAIMGGAKISDKIIIIERLLDKVDHLIIGGGMSYTFFKAMGGDVGNSLVEEDKLELARSLMSKAKEKGVDILLPNDSIIADGFNNEANTQTTSSKSISDGWMGLDIGPEAIHTFSKVIEQSKTILWNGPMGVFEMKNFSKGTNSLAQAVVKATQNGAFSLIGGGDSASAINNLGYGDQVSYVSTGGGALLEYMEGKVLPGIAALEA